MNFGLLAQMAVPALPDPPAMSWLLFEEPLLLTAICIVAAVSGFVFLNARGRVRNAVIVGGVGFLLAVGVQVLAAMVETPREKLIKATGALVAATAHMDGAMLSPMLDAKVRLSNGFGVAEWEGDAADRAELIAKVQDVLGRKYPLKECAILETHAVVDGPGIGRSQVRVRAVPQQFAVPIVSWWRIDWREQKDGWVATGIEPLDLGVGGIRGR